MERAQFVHVSRPDSGECVPGWCRKVPVVIDECVSAFGGALTRAGNFLTGNAEAKLMQFNATSSL